jgi:hypothetical protein
MAVKESGRRTLEPAFYLPLVKPRKIGKVFNKVW